MRDLRHYDTVKQQYATAKNLDIRIALHQKYSVNKEGFGTWIFRQYNLLQGCRILELGCGTGEMWAGNYRKLPEGVRLTLTDFSAGMLERARTALSQQAVEFAQVDIQNIPYDNESFDVVIANMMLYHVPDLQRGLGEVKRVLRPGGTFYCATYGENGILEYLRELLGASLPAKGLNKSFTLQNGAVQLTKQFSHVEMRLYDDALRVTDTADLIAYIRSLDALSGLPAFTDGQLYSLLEARRKQGAISIPKEYGMFLCKK